MDSKVILILLRQVHDGVKQDHGDLFVFVRELFREDLVLKVSLNYVVKSFGYIIALLILLLNRVVKLFLHKVALFHLRDALWHDREEVDLCAQIHSPGHLFFNVLSKDEALLLAHLPVFALFRVATTFLAALNFMLRAEAILLFDLLKQVALWILGQNFRHF